MEQYDKVQASTDCELSNDHIHMTLSWIQSKSDEQDDDRTQCPNILREGLCEFGFSPNVELVMFPDVVALCGVVIQDLIKSMWADN